MTAPRIDQVRKRLNAAITRLAQATEHIEDLHAIGWYRHADHSQRERVSSSTTASDWSLDNNGDAKARAAYEHLANELIDIEARATKAIDDAMATFDTGLIRNRRDQTADASAHEVITALGRRDKRKLLGEYTSATTVAQPLPQGARQYLNAAQLLEELDALRTAVRKTRTRPDRTRFTPREATAWDNALGIDRRRRKKTKRP